MYKKILVPLDGSPLAEAVLPHAKALAKSEDAELVLLRVAIDLGGEFAFEDPAIAADMVKQMESETAIYMTEAKSKVESDGVKVSVIVREGLIAETILAAAEEIGADVIAMSTHGRSGVRRWFMGSVADRVVNHSKVPVMLIRPPQ